MNKVDLHQNLTVLKDFALSSPSSNAYQTLKEPFVFPKAHAGTHMEYIWRLIHDADDILTGSKHAEDKPTFTKEDILQTVASFKSLNKIAQDPSRAGHQEWKTVKNLPISLEKILSHHLNEAAAYNTQMTALDIESEDLPASFLKACNQKDYAALAKFYPYQNIMSEIANATDWNEKGVADMMTQMFSAVANLTPEAVKHWFGKPQNDISSETKHSLRQYQKHSLQIWKDGQNLVSTLYDLTKNPKLSAVPLADLIPRDVAP